MGEEYTLGIIGARTFADYPILEESLVGIIKKHGLPHTVVSGGARGAGGAAVPGATAAGGGGGAVPLPEPLPEPPETCAKWDSNTATTLLT